MNGILQGWFQPICKRIGFQDMQYAIRNNYNIINTLTLDNQECLIKNTISVNAEERIINDLLNQYIQKPFVIYGKNSVDQTVDRKYNQLMQLGFKEVYIYSGGLFEWMLLQDVYGIDEFPTTKKVLDILKYKPENILMSIR